MKLAWCTDIHLNFLDRDDRLAFYHEVSKAKADALMITGDIGESNDVVGYLVEINDELQMPTYFVLGNHDFWRSSREDVLEAVKAIPDYPQIIYLPTNFHVKLTDETMLVGTDGWADGRYGDYAKSWVQLNDSHFIKDFHHKDKTELLLIMQKFADADAAILRGNLDDAIAEKSKRIIVATHIPPFPEVSYYRGNQSNSNFLPFYTCKAVGDVLLHYASNNPDIVFDVYCGHTHGAANYKSLPNLTVTAGEAEYNAPMLQQSIIVK